jgi:hypothetical protein
MSSFVNVVAIFLFWRKHSIFWRNKSPAFGVKGGALRVADQNSWNRCDKE